MAFLSSTKTIKPARCSRSASSRQTTVRTVALFGWGKQAADDRKADKDEQFRVQQELLQNRKNGSLIKEASDRRKNVKATVAERKAERQSEKDSLSKGIIPESLKNWSNYKSKDDAEGRSGIIVPLLPFGLKEFDEGERFDLRSPYADEGWVDPEETDMWAGLKKIGTKILNFSGNNDVFNEQYGKPILWAKDYGKYKADKEAAAAEKQAQKALDKKNKKN